jgi:hypothetical protein
VDPFTAVLRAVFVIAIALGAAGTRNEQRSDHMPPLTIATYAADVSPTAYTDADGNLMTVPPAATLQLHTFAADVDGRLVHSIGGTVRAIVPPEGFADYAKAWPAAAPLIEELGGEVDPAGADSDDADTERHRHHRHGRRR